jgi:hypothetical protein
MRMADPPRPFHAGDLFYRQIPREFIVPDALRAAEAPRESKGD